MLNTGTCPSGGGVCDLSPGPAGGPTRPPLGPGMCQGPERSRCALRPVCQSGCSAVGLGRAPWLAALRALMLRTRRRQSRLSGNPHLTGMFVQGRPGSGRQQQSRPQTWSHLRAPVYFCRCLYRQESWGGALLPAPSAEDHWASQFARAVVPGSSSQRSRFPSQKCPCWDGPLHAHHRPPEALLFTQLPAHCHPARASAVSTRDATRACMCGEAAALEQG